MMGKIFTLMPGALYALITIVMPNIFFMVPFLYTFEFPFAICTILETIFWNFTKQLRLLKESSNIRVDKGQPTVQISLCGDTCLKRIKVCARKKEVLAVPKMCTFKVIDFNWTAEHIYLTIVSTTHASELLRLWSALLEAVLRIKRNVNIWLMFKWPKAGFHMQLEFLFKIRRRPNLMEKRGLPP